MPVQKDRTSHLQKPPMSCFFHFRFRIYSPCLMRTHRLNRTHTMVLSQINIEHGRYIRLWRGSCVDLVGLCSRPFHLFLTWHYSLQVCAMENVTPFFIVVCFCCTWCFVLLEILRKTTLWIFIWFSAQRKTRDESMMNLWRSWIIVDA